MVPIISTCFRWQIVLLVITCYITPVYAAEKADQAIEIYVHHSTPDKVYSLSDVRAIFAMRKNRWPDGEKIQVFVLPDNNSYHRQFSKSKLKMFPHQLRRIWDRLIFSGIGHAPIEINSLEEMKAKIESTPGSIGYLKGTNNNKNIRIMSYE